MRLSDMEKRMLQEFHATFTKFRQDISTDCEKHLFTFKMSQLEMYLIISIVILIIGILSTWIICLYTSRKVIHDVDEVFKLIN
jgi:hypothetical protein